MAALIASAPAKAQGGSLEYAVKATFLYKFAPFVDWPPQAFASKTSPFNLCIVARDPFGDILEKAVASEHVHDRPIAIHRLETANHASGCHAMFVGGANIAQILENVRGAPILTFTDSSQNPEIKGMVHFVIRENRVRFEIDDERASQSGLTISSKVLSLAVSVKRRP